jgi:hypothetical protein
MARTLVTQDTAQKTAVAFQQRQREQQQQDCEQHIGEGNRQR